MNWSFPETWRGDDTADRHPTFGLNMKRHYMLEERDDDRRYP